MSFGLSLFLWLWAILLTDVIESFERGCMWLHWLALPFPIKQIRILSENLFLMLCFSAGPDSQAVEKGLPGVDATTVGPSLASRPLEGPKALHDINGTKHSTAAGSDAMAAVACKLTGTACSTVGGSNLERVPEPTHVHHMKGT